MALRVTGTEPHLASHLWQAYADKLADKLMDSGNLIFGALIVGQLISTWEFNWWITGLGLVALLGFYRAAYIVTMRAE